MTGIRHSMRLPHDETDETKRYSMADPDALAELAHSAHVAVYSDKRPLTREESTALLSIAQSYMALTTYELGQEHCVGKLRDIWRARRPGPPRPQNAGTFSRG